MSRRLNNAAVWASMLTVFLVVAVESRTPVDDDVDETATAEVDQTSRARGQHEHVFVWETANPRRRRRPPSSSSSVQLVGVDVRRIQRKAGVTEEEEDVEENYNDDNDATNSTNHHSDDDATVVDQLHLARIRSDFLPTEQIYCGGIVAVNTATLKP